MYRLGLGLGLWLLFTSLAWAQDVYEYHGQLAQLLRHQTTRGTELVLPPTGPQGWLLVGPWPTGRVTLTPNPEETRHPIEFPSVAGTAVWLEIPWDSSLSKLRLNTTGLFPASLRLVFSEQQNHSTTPLLIQHQGAYDIYLPPWQVDRGFWPSLQIEWSGKDGWKLSVADDVNEQVFQFSSGLAGPHTWNYYPAVWKAEPRHLVCTPVSPGTLTLLSLTPRGTHKNDPIIADPETLLHWPVSVWQHSDHQWFLWEDRPNILVLISLNYEVQDQFLKRLAFFVEKPGFRGRLVSDAEFKDLHGWNAHDYAPADLARFFNRAADQNFQLSNDEIELRQRLVAQGILVVAGNHLEAGQGALLGVSDASPPALRAFLFTHESFHGLYFTSPRFRAYVDRIWSGLSSQAQETFRHFLAVSGYDASFEALMVNEFQAYCLQQPPNWWTDFFFDRVLARGAPQETGPQRITLEQEFFSAATLLNLEAEHLFGVGSGQVMNPILGPVTTPAGKK